MASRSRSAAALSSEVEADSREVSLGLEAEQARHLTLQESKEARPRATNAAYEPRQKEFQKWCDKKGFNASTRYTVTGMLFSVLHYTCLLKLSLFYTYR